MHEYKGKKVGKETFFSTDVSILVELVGILAFFKKRVLPLA
jgi:hypothetical protein